VLDVNNNPANPVIGVRSFSEDPRLVADMGAALIHGLQEHGMMATGKHFPGHGDTEENSHLTVTTLHASRARIDTVELVPFRRAIAAGVQGIMTFHGLVPALDTASVPATLNPAIMTGLLRRQLGFKGLLITDAMDMNGVLARVTVGQAANRGGQAVTGNYGTINNSIGIAEACKLAIAAGADILLMPSDVTAAIDAVVAGVREGRFTQATSIRPSGASSRSAPIQSGSAAPRQSRQRAIACRRHGQPHGCGTAAQRSSRLPGFSESRAVRAAGPTAPRVLSITIATRADLPAGATFNAELRRGSGAADRADQPR
jgi:beta-N-acetylhexosaminidase